MNPDIRKTRPKAGFSYIWRKADGITPASSQHSSDLTEHSSQCHHAEYQCEQSNCLAETNNHDVEGESFSGLTQSI